MMLVNYYIHSWFNLNDVIFNYYFLIGGLFLSYLIYKIIQTLLSSDNYMETKYQTRGHTWRSIQCNKSIPYSIHCTICSKLMLPVAGLFCECCAVSACKQCHHKVDKKFRCKSISWPIDKVFYHHWVKVGTARGDCVEGNDECYKRYFCSWCQRSKLCLDSAFNDSEPCDFFKYKNIIIRPCSVQLHKNVVVSIKPEMDEDWEPLIIIANRKSGGNKNDEVLSLFRGLLNPIQVVDLSVTSPEQTARWLPARCRVLVAGGDGTVAWVLNALRATPLVRAAVGILPMGTGNDLSRVLGWGATHAADLSAQALICAMWQAVEQSLDRWKITIIPKGRLGRIRTERVMYAYNYASIGVDAQVALDFHRARTQFLYRYTNRWLNYLAYAVLGASRALDDGGCGGLEQRLRVKVDGESLPLPPLQALVLLNITSWGAGVDLWSMGDADEVEEQSISDGKIEVVGISSSFHIARLQCGLAEPYRFAQASRVEMELTGSSAMQVDGEPWMQSAARIIVEPAGSCLMLRPRAATELNHADSTC